MSVRLVPVALAVVSLCAPLVAYADPPTVEVPSSAGAPAPGPAYEPAARTKSGGKSCRRSCDWSRRAWAPMPPATRVSLELGGAAGLTGPRAEARISLKPEGLSRWGFGIGAFANPVAWRGSSGSLGTAGIGLNNADATVSEARSVGVRQGYDLSVTRYFGCGGPGGLFLSARVSAAQLALRDDAAPGVEARPWLLTVSPQLGVQWFPFRQRTVFLRPYFGGDFRVASVGSMAVADAPYAARVASATGGLDLGFEL